LEHLLYGSEVDPKVREKIANYLELIRDNRQMVALDLDLPLPSPIPSMTIGPRYPELIESLRNFEFRGLTAEVEREAAGKFSASGIRNSKERGQGSDLSSDSGEAPMSSQQSTGSTQGELFS
jgi:hypothetical protein